MTLKIAILGAAHLWHAISYGSAVQRAEGADLVGFVEPDADIAELVTTHLGAPWLGRTSDALDGSAVDGLIVCSATRDHRSDVEYAAARGAHVFCEKPISTTRADALRMIRVCHEAGVQLQVGFVSRFYPMVAEARLRVRSGDIGEVRAVVGLNRGRPPLQPDYPSWFTDSVMAGGGALIDHSVHVTDAIRYITGLEPREVLATTGQLFWDFEVEDAAVISLVFDNAAVGAIDPSWSVPRSNPWDYDFRIQVVGTTGTILIDDSRETISVSSDRTGTTTSASFGIDLDQLAINEFLETSRTSRASGTSADGQDGLRALDVALAAYDSVRSGHRVTIPFKD